MYVDTPRDYISRVYDQLVYGDEPLGWNILGTKETIQARLARHVPRLRRPLVLARADGRRPRRQPRRRSRSRRSRSCSATCPPRRPSTPPPSPFADNGRVRVHEKVSDQAHLCLGVAGYPIQHPDRYVVELLRTVLGGGMSSRLFTEVRERRGLAYYVFAANQGVHRLGHALLAGRRRPQAGRRGGDDDPRRAAQDRGRAGAGGRAREGAVVREGPLRPLAREPAGDEHVRPPPRGARGPGDRADRGARRARQGDGRGRAARRAGPDARGGVPAGR